MKKPECKFCGKDGRVYKGRKRDGDTYEYRCEYCGATYSNGEWQKICSTCGKAVKELVGLFVPHNCSRCQKGVIDRDIKTGNVCGMCRKPRSVCCC